MSWPRQVPWPGSESESESAGPAKSFDYSARGLSLSESAGETRLLAEIVTLLLARPPGGGGGGGGGPPRRVRLRVYPPGLTVTIGGA